MKQYFAFVALGAMSVALASPAAAVTVLPYELTTGNLPGAMTVHSDETQDSKLTVSGYVNGEDSKVYFTSPQLLSITGSGQATVTGVSEITTLVVSFDHGWEGITFNLGKGEADLSTFNLRVNGSTDFVYGDAPNCDICFVDNGENRFTLTGPNISLLEFSFSPAIGSVRQFRVEGVSPAIPEPATWAMMIGGLGLAGGLLRRRTSKVQFA